MSTTYLHTPFHISAEQSVSGMPSPVFELLYNRSNPANISTPLVRRRGKLKPIGWPEAIEIAGLHLNDYCKSGQHAHILHVPTVCDSWQYTEYGSLFFGLLGGVCSFSEQVSPYDVALSATLGKSQTFDAQEIENASLIIIWGTQLAEDLSPLTAKIRLALKRGAMLVDVSPLCSQLSKEAHLQIPLLPATDGALALGVASLIVKSRQYDSSFIEQLTGGFNEFAHMLEGYTPTAVASICGIAEEQIIRLAALVREQRGMCMILGSALEKYANAGQTIRAIAALNILTGNLNIPGSGIFRAKPSPAARRGLTIAHDSVLYYQRFTGIHPAKEILSASPSPRLIWLEGDDPLAGWPDFGLLNTALQKADFVVCVSPFHTVSTGLADLVLPCLPFAIEGDTRLTADIFYEHLADSLQMATAFTQATAAIRQFTPNEADMSAQFHPGGFETPSGRIELKADSLRERWGVHSLPTYEPSGEAHMQQHPDSAEEYCLVGQSATGFDSEPFASVHPSHFKLKRHNADSRITLWNQRGEMTLRLRPDYGVRPGVVAVFPGRGQQKINLNLFTSGETPLMGNIPVQRGAYVFLNFH